MVVIGLAARVEEDIVAYAASPGGAKSVEGATDHGKPEHTLGIDRSVVCSASVRRDSTYILLPYLYLCSIEMFLPPSEYVTC